MNYLAMVAVALTVLVETAEQFAFKYASRDSRRKTLWTTIAIALHIPHLIAWFFALSILPLAVATPLLGAAYITVPLTGKLLFKERVDKRRWLGIGAILCGLILVADAI